MSKGFYRDVIEALRKHGYYKSDGGKGSHEKWVSDDESKPTVTVPFNLQSRHTANGIMKDAGIDQKF
jgi:predicted RNA binding protein YcfA (HicA-like mRNA interferase family)